jgi:hypothetical protein
MRKIYVVLVLLFGLFAGANAQSSGVFESYAIFSINGGANAYYDLQPTSGNPDLQGANLGNYIKGTNTLVIRGGQNKTFKNGSCNITGSTIFYRVFPTGSPSGAFTSINEPFASNLPSPGDQQWEQAGNTTELIATLSPGKYTLQAYTTADYNGCGTGTHLINNGGLNYNATFIVCAPSLGALPAGNYPIPTGCFTTVAAAVSYINTNGISGAVQFDVAAGYAETAPVGGFNITATGTSTNTIIFKKDGSGVNPTITAPAQTGGSLIDGIIKIIGGDFITINGFTLLERTFTPIGTDIVAGTNTMTEFGVALLNASISDGPQNITITNCTIDLDIRYSNTFAIYSNSSHSSSSVTVGTTTSVGGEHNNITITKNIINDVNLPISFVGSTSAANSQNDGIIIGGSGNGNTITNFGRVQANGGFINVTSNIYGVNIRNSKNYNVSNNSFTSVTTAALSSLSAVFVDGYNNPPTGTNNINIDSNSISLGCASCAAINSINVSSLSGTATSVNINKNDFNNYTIPTSGTATILRFIQTSQTATTSNINNNTFTNINVATTGNVTFITNNTSAALGATKTVNGNKIVTAFNKTGAGGVVSIYVDAGSSVTGATVVNDGNEFSNITLTAATTAIQGWSNLDGATSSTTMPTKTITNNKFENWSTTAGAACVVMDLNGFGGTTSSVSNNTITNIIKSGANALTGINLQARGIATTLNVSNNIIDGLTNGAATLYGITDVNTSLTSNITQNQIKNLTSVGTTFYAINHQTAANILNISNNIINNLTSTATTTGAALRGISNSAAATVTIDNNAINNLSLNYSLSGNTITGISCSNAASGTTPSTKNNVLHTFSGISTVNTSQVIGISVGGSQNNDISNNKIYNLTGNSSTTSLTAPAVVGIISGSSGTVQKINSDTIYNLKMDNASNNNNSVVAISTTSSSGGQINANTIYGFESKSTGANPYIAGYIPNGGGWTFTNNMISLSNGSLTNGMQCTGIFDNGATGTRKYYYNSINIAGSSSASTVSIAAQFNSGVGTTDIKNNIFDNIRTGSTKNYAVANLSALFTGLTFNYNLFNSPVATSIGLITGSVDRTFAQWQTSSSGDGNSLTNKVVTYSAVATANLHLSTNNCALDGAGTPVTSTTTIDFDNDTRNSSTPDIGADEFTADNRSGSITAAASTICTGSSTTINFNLSSNVGTSVWSAIYTINGAAQSAITNTSGANFAAITVSPTVNTTYALTSITSGSCTVSPLSPSSVVVNVSPTTVAGTVSSSQTICEGATPTALTLAGNTGAVVKWQSSTDLAFTAPVDIANTTTTLTLGALSTTTYYRAVVKSGACLEVNTAAVTIDVTLTPTFANLNSPLTGAVCQGSPFVSYGKVSLAGVTSIPGASATITAEFGYSSTNNNPNSGGWTWLPATFNLQIVNDDEYTYSFTPATAGTYYYTYRFRQGACTWVYGGFGSVGNGFWNGTTNVNGTLTVSATSAVGVASTSQTICSGSTPVALNIASNVGSIQWQSSNNNVSFTNIGGANGATLTLGALTATTYYRCVVTNGACASVTSNTVTITVDPIPTFANLQFPSTGAVCQGSPFTSYGKVFIAGITNLAGDDSNITAEFGYSSTNNNPNSGGWSWLPATYQGQALNDDEYTNTFSPPAAGTFYYTFRFRFGTTCDWVYGGYNGGFWNGGTNVNGVLTVNALPTVSITSNNSPICSGSNAIFNLTGTSGAVVSYNINGGANTTVTLTGGTGVVTVAAAIATQTLNLVSVTNAGCPVVVSGSSVVNINPAGTWTGATNTDWNTTTNWCGNVVPTSATNVTIPTGLTNYPTIGMGISALSNNITIAAGATVTVSSTGVLNLYGNITNAGILDLTDGKLNVLSAITLSGATVKNKTIKDIVVSNSFALSSTANDTLKITGSVQFVGNNKTFATNDNLTLVSNINGTANIGDLTNGVPANVNNAVTGKVNIERYLRAYKSWRFLATPIKSNSTQTINSAWQENNVGGIGLTSTGYGTQITGPATGAFPVVGTDVVSQGTSMKYYDGDANAFVSIANTADPIYNPAGYFLFVRGDRSVGQFGATGTTTMRMKGVINTGDQTFTIPSTGGFKAIGNPYPSQIDFGSVTKTTVDGYTIWNPNPVGTAYGVGKYEQYVNDGFGNYRYLGGPAQNFIESGQGFFVQSIGAATITIKEIDKRNASNLVSRMGVNDPTLEVNLYAREATTGTFYKADGIIQKYDVGFNNSINNGDVLKIFNNADNLFITNSNQKLLYERRKPLVETDTIFLNLTNTRVAPYKFVIDPSVLANTGLKAILKDKFLQSETEVSLMDSTTVNFDITADVASRVADRFMIVFKSIANPQFTTIAAVRNADKTVKVTWTVQNELSINNYSIEQSNDGVNFTPIASKNAVGNNGSNQAYSIIDVAASKSNNWYRVKANIANSAAKYTAIAMVSALPADAIVSPMISVFPNPVTNNKLVIKFANNKGAYTASFINTAGQTMFNTSFKITGIEEIKTIPLSENILAGKYTLVLIDSDGNKQSIAVLVK